jgi:hypothetical protein
VEGVGEHECGEPDILPDFGGGEGGVCAGDLQQYCVCLSSTRFKYEVYLLLCIGKKMLIPN